MNARKLFRQLLVRRMKEAGITSEEFAAAAKAHEWKACGPGTWERRVEYLCECKRRGLSLTEKIDL